MRTPLAVIVALLAILVPIGFATDDGAAPARPASTAVSTVAQRVEQLRGVRFERIPRPVSVTGDQARREGLADLDRGYPPGRRRADEALYTRLGLLPAGTDLRKVSSSVFGEQVAGYYDPRTGRLALVEDATGASPVMTEVTLAHELVHALEDQRFGLETERVETSGDAGLAYTALVEGTATAVMFEYLERHFSPGQALGGLLGSALAGGDTSGLPPFVMASLLFPYERGKSFVETLYRRAGGRWDLVDLALRERPPLSSEQVMHPEKWIRVEAPEKVTLPGLAKALGEGWRRLGSGSFGEFQTGRLLAEGGRNVPDAAAGWGGDRYEIWRREGATACRVPCTDRDAVVIRWRWDTRRDATEFLPALRAAVAGLPHASIAVRPRETTLALAPDGALARRLAELGAS